MPQNSHATLAYSIDHVSRGRGPQPSLIDMCFLIIDFSTPLDREIVLSIRIPKLPESYAAFYFLRGRRVSRFIQPLFLNYEFIKRETPFL